METVVILWSGGWDGTFRMLELAKMGVVVQPVYIIDKARLSAEYEIRAMQQILEKLRAINPSGGNGSSFEDIIFYDKDTILTECADERISASFGRLRSKYGVGTQYEWFALLTAKLGIRMEAAVVHQYHGKVENAIDAEGRYVEYDDDPILGRIHILGPEGAKESDIENVFGNIILPSIRITKKDEENIARENGWMDIMLLSWFCHNPINGEPCGLCGPCDDAMNTGMEWRMPKSAQDRYFAKKEGELHA